MMALPWVALAAAVVAVAVLIIKYHRQIWAFVQRVWHDILAVIMGVWNWIRRNWPLLLAILTGPIGHGRPADHPPLELHPRRAEGRPEDDPVGVEHGVGDAAARVPVCSSSTGSSACSGCIVHGAACGVRVGTRPRRTARGAEQAFDTVPRERQQVARPDQRAGPVHVSVAMTPSKSNPYAGVGWAGHRGHVGGKGPARRG